MFLEGGKLSVHLFEFFGLLETIRTAIRRILAFKIEVSASLARSISITFDLSTLAFVAVRAMLASIGGISMCGTGVHGDSPGTLK